MTALAANRATRRLGTGQHNTTWRFPLAASTKIYAGSLVALNASGYLVPASADNSLLVMGEATEYVDNSAGAAGALYCVVERGVFGYVNGSGVEALTAADLGRVCYALDDQTVNRTFGMGARPAVGRVVAIEDSLVFVEIGHSQGNPGNVDIYVPANADLSTKQFYLMALGSNGKVDTLTTAGGDACGVLQNTPAAANAIAIVRIFGTTKAIASTAIATGARLASTNAGKTKAAVAGKVDTSDAGAAADPLIGSYVIGQALSDGATDTAHQIILAPMGAIPSTAA